MRRQSSVRLGRGSRSSPKLRETNPDGFGSLTPLGDVDHYTLALVEGADPGSLEHRGVHEGILAAAFADDEAKALLRIEPLHRAHFFNGGLRRRQVRGGISRSAGHRRRRRAAIDAEDLGDLRSLLPGRYADLERFA